MTLYPQGHRPRREKRVPKPLLRGKNLRKPRKRLRKQRKTTAGQKARKGPTAKRRAEKRARTIKADAVWALKVREKYGDRCFHYFCGNPATDTHHIIGKKAHPELRYVVENGAPMCREHHDEAHARPKWFKENFRGWYHPRWCRLMDKAA